MYSVYLKVPSQRAFKFFDTLDIRPDEGRIFNSTGKEIGTFSKHDRRYTISKTFDGKQHFWKRYHVIWWKVHGKWPRVELDHKNRVSDDDCIDNLQESTRRLQRLNQNPMRPRTGPGKVANLEEFKRRLLA